MDQQQEQQKPGDPNTTQNQNQLTDAEVEQQKAKNDADKAAAEQQQAKKDADKAAAEQQARTAPGAPAEHVGLLGRIGHGVEHATGIEAIERHERRRQAFSAAKAGPVGKAIDDVNAFLNAMHDCDADTPEEMLADTDVQNAAKRAREGLKVFTGDTPVTFSKPTSDAHLNVGTGGAVTGNTLANKQKAAAVKAEHGDPLPKAKGEEDDEDEDELAAAGTKVPQPDAHVR